MKKVFLLIISGIIIYSCQKEPSSNTPPIVTRDDSTTLLMYIDLDTTQAAGLDTLNIQKYSYDNSKRLMKSAYIEYESGMPAHFSITNLYYNGTDTLPFKKTETNYDSPGGTAGLSDTAYYIYNGDKIISDSVRSGYNSFPVVGKYAYDNNKVTETRLDYSLTPPAYPYSHEVYLTKINGNTTLQMDTTFLDGVLSSSTRFSFVYDVKINPFYNIPQPFVERSFPYYDGETYSEEMVYEKNNPTDINETGDPFGTGAFHFKYFYEYKSNGYPSVARVYDQDDPSNFYKRIFIYTKL